MKTLCRTSVLFCCLVSGGPLHAQEEGIGAVDPKAELSGDIELPQTDGLENIDLSRAGEANTAAKALRFTIGQEASVRTRGAHGVVNNRSSFRVEYSKFFLDSFFVQIDSKLNAFWYNDHRAVAQDKKLLFETSTQEAFLQYSGADGHTSLKAGVQRLIWGESEGGAITDVVSPRNSSELFLIPLEESRIGQFMLNLDYFSPYGDWSGFFVPDPKMNKYPDTGTAYYLDPFNGLADIRDASYDKKQYEYGMRWKKTFGKSDISFMAASLMDNDYVFRRDGVTDAGRQLFSRLKRRFTLAGVTGNYAVGKVLFKGEVALKGPKTFNDTSFQIVEKDVVDSSLGLTYSLGESNSVGLELVNGHVLNWNEQIVSAQRNTSSLVLNTNLFFLNDTLSVNWLMIYGQPFTSYLSSVRTSYKWKDDITFSVDAHFVAAPDKNSPLRPYRDQSQVVFRVQHQF